MKKLKHSKFKNTGFLFELLLRQITSEIMASNKSKAEKIIQEFFNSKKELSKELKLYHYLLNEKYNSESKAEKFIDTVCEARKRLDENKLNKEKYNLIKSIKEHYNIDDLINSNITNYRTLASIYKIFETIVSEEQYEPTEIVNARFTITENIINKSIHNKNTRIKNEVLEHFKQQDEIIRNISYKILIESFNSKYKDLSQDQKSLLREYINGMTNTTKLKDYINSEVEAIAKSLSETNKKITDKITKIKLQETIEQIKKIKSSKKIKEEYLSALMIAYELNKELKSKI